MSPCLRVSGSRPVRAALTSPPPLAMLPSSTNCRHRCSVRRDPRRCPYRCHLHPTALLGIILLVLLTPCGLADANPRRPNPARLVMDPPAQAELDVQAGLALPPPRPLRGGVVFWDQNGDGSVGSSQCDRGRRDLHVADTGCLYCQRQRHQLVPDGQRGSPGDHAAGRRASVPAAGAAQLSRRAARPDARAPHQTLAEINGRPRAPDARLRDR